MGTLPLIFRLILLLLQARKRVLISRLQESGKNSRARRVAQPILMEDDDYDDDDEDDYDDERNNVKQQEDAEVKERLEKLSRYEAAVAQINKLSDQLVGGPPRGKAAASKTDGTGRAAAPKADDGGNAGPKSSRPETVKNRVASPKEKSLVSAEASSSEKPKRARAPKTRFTNPLTGSVVEQYLTIVYGSGFGSDFWQVTVPVPAPHLDNKEQV